APPAKATLGDGTLGAGGHSRALLEAAGPGSTIVGLDRDPSALEVARARLAEVAASSTVHLVHASFDELESVARKLGVGPFDSILLDLGVSSMQLDQPQRGFTFMDEGPLDMRMD